MKRAPLGSLQALRAVAAVLVVMLHAQETFALKAGSTPFGGMFSGGGRGVDLFFVLSGFIIMYTHGADRGRPNRAGAYVLKRLSRIYPGVFIVTGLTAILATAGLGGSYTAGKLGLSNVIASCLLIPQAQGPLVGVTWTLQFEMFFYLIFLLIIVLPRLGLMLLAVWQTAVIVVSAVVPHVPNDALRTYLQPVCLEFAIGVGCAVGVSKLSRHAIPPIVLGGILLAGSAAFVFGAMVDTYAFTHLPRLPDVAWFGSCAAAIVTALVLLEIGGHLRVARWIVQLGNKSYAIYLFHFSALVVLSRMVTPFIADGPGAHRDAACVLVAAASVAFGIAFDAWVDRPIQGMIKRIAARGSGLHSPRDPAPVAV